jgi:alkaline phosphatase D
MRVFIFRATALLSLCFVLSCASSGRGRLDLGPAIDDPAQLEKLCVGGSSAACALAGKPATPMHPVPILQGLTGPSETRLLVQAPKSAPLAYFVRGGGKIRKAEFNRNLIKGTQVAVDRLEIFNLPAGVEFEFIVAGEDGVLWDKRSFSGLNPAKKNAKVAVASCIDENWRDIQKQMWTDVLAKKPDAIFLIGDNVYADIPPVTGLEHLLRRYSESRGGLELFRAARLVPVFATWDDHDYGQNDSDRTWVHKQAATSTFFQFFPQEQSGANFQRGPGVSSWWKAFGVNFALLDGRSFRSPNGLDLPDQTHFGAEQEKWIQQNLKDAREPVFLMSGDQFFGEYEVCESYQTNHPKSLKAQLAQWKKARVPIVFVSGDRHMTEINEVSRKLMGYTTYELTSSAIHARVYKGSFERCPPPAQVVGVTGEMNYMILGIERASKAQLKLNVQSFGLENKSLFQKTLTVKR